jgi:UDP-N-acetylglucosamine/UDP-N-acetylgalactosamine diphosphorylase
MTTFPADLDARLRQFGHGHLLACEPTPAFAAQLAAVDFAELADLFARRGETAAPADLQPIPVTEASAFTAADREAGEAALRRGEVAALVVAGGQGSRLGFDKPKGLFPVGPAGESLFQLFAEQVRDLGARYGPPVPLLVMTSPATDADTRAFFAENRDFGLAPGQVRFFTQGTMPAVDLVTGKLLLEAPGRLALSPNGHGGTLTALADSGQLARLDADGVRHAFYFQVDNPLVRIAEPGFVGRHTLSGSEASTKVVRKEQPGERVGVLALVDGRCGIVEYSDLPRELADRRTPDGRLAFDAGNTAMHLFAVSFLRAVTTGAGRLPYHLARKRVPYYDPATGTAVTPAAENALKFERFVFDALPAADRFLVVAVGRDEFAPLKNAAGPDSPETVRAAVAARTTSSCSTR